MSDPCLQRDAFVWLLGSLCGLHRLPFSAPLVIQQVPPPYDRGSLVAAAEKLGLRVESVEIHRAPELQAKQPTNGLAPSFIAFSGSARAGARDAEETNDSLAAGSASTSAVLIGRIEGGRAVYFKPCSDQPHIASWEEFASTLEPVVLGFARAAPVQSVELETSSSEVHAASASRFGFGWFADELLKYKRIWRDVLLASLAIQLMALATPLFTQVVIDKVVVHHTESTLIAVGVGLFIFMMFSAVLIWIRQYLVLHTGNRVDAVLGSAVFRHLFALPPRYFEHRATGVIAARLHGVETIREFIASTAVTLLLDIPFLLIFLAIMFWYSVTLTLIALALISLIAVLSFFAAPLFRGRLNEQFLLGARNQAFVTEYVAGMETVKSLQMEPQLDQIYRDYLGTYLQAGFRVKQIGNTYNVIANTIDQMSTLAILIVGAYVVMTEPGFSIGMLVAFQMFSGRVSQPILRLVGLWQQFQQASIAVKRLGDILNAPTEPYAIVPKRLASQVTGGAQIKIERLAFRYAENLPYLYRDLTVTIEPGQIVAVVGPSGCGKSTLSKLLQAFYQPSEGSIKIDGIDIRHLSANELRSHFGIVPQETTLFSGTIFRNLAYANPNASFEDVVSAARQAEIHDVIEQLPNGYETEIGERGVGLSGGQKQRIAIAGALLKKPTALIFDEAIANLDLNTSEQIANTVNSLRQSISVIFVSHAIPRNLKFDRVLRLGAHLPLMHATTQRTTTKLDSSGVSSIATN